MEAIPPFYMWLQADVQSDLVVGQQVEDLVENSFEMPSLETRKYKSLYAYRYHYRVKSVEEGLVTKDSRVATIFHQPCRSGRHDQNLVDAALEYIGEILKIIELDYRRFLFLYANG